MDCPSGTELTRQRHHIRRGVGPLLMPGVIRLDLISQLDLKDFKPRKHYSFARFLFNTKTAQVSRKDQSWELCLGCLYFEALLAKAPKIFFYTGVTAGYVTGNT